MNDLIDEYTVVKECEYKGERYSVRDNGAVLRHAKEGKKPRPLNEIWTFGNKGSNGYMYLGSVRVHTIVATAFHGIQDSSIYVVDHIDENKCNNRSENLRWLTRLENALMNPATLKRIIYLCGSIEAFIKDPSCLRDFTGDNQDIGWMRTVTAEEARNAYERVNNFARRPIRPNTHNSFNLTDEARDQKKEWLFTSPTRHEYSEPENMTYRAEYPSTALQLNWKTPTRFLCCPTEKTENPLQSYLDKLTVGTLFCENQYNKQIIDEAAMVDEGSAIVVRTHMENPDAIKPYGITKIFHSGTQFIHESISTYFEENGAKKEMVEQKGLIWDGPECFDDYC